MDKKSKILIIIFFLLLLVSALVTYKRTMIDRDFDIENTKPEQEL